MRADRAIRTALRCDTDHDCLVLMVDHAVGCSVQEVSGAGDTDEIWRWKRQCTAMMPAKRMSGSPAVVSASSVLLAFANSVSTCFR